MEGIEEGFVKRHRVRCVADWEPSPRGCSGAGPWAWSVSEARDAAEEMGWEVDRRGAICPAHRETHL